MRAFINERHPYTEEVTLASQLLHLYPRQPEKAGDDTDAAICAAGNKTAHLQSPWKTEDVNHYWAVL